MKAPRTICANCKHAMSEGRGAFSESRWYSQLCRAFPNEEAIDPISGRVVWVNGAGCRQLRQYDFCRNHNFGDCEQYLKKRKEEA